MKSLVIICCAITGFLMANEENSVPSAYPSDRYAPTWGRNPFLVTTTNPPPKSSWEQDWVLLGTTVLEKQGAFALIQNVHTREVVRVESKPNIHGFKLIACQPDPARKASTAEISLHGKIASLPLANTTAAQSAQNKPDRPEPVPTPINSQSRRRLLIPPAQPAPGAPPQ